MCKRQWAGFTDCNDIRTTEHRCPRNPIDKPVEYCDNRQVDQETRKSCEAFGILLHPDPPIAIFPGRCDEWVGSADDDKKWEASGKHGLRITKPTWIMCSNDWHDAVGILDRDRWFALWEDIEEQKSSRRMQCTWQDQATAPTTVATKNLQNGISNNGSIPGPRKPSKNKRIASTRVDIDGSPLNSASKDATSKRSTAGGRKSKVRTPSDDCLVEHSRKKKSRKIKSSNTVIKDLKGEENKEEPTEINDEKY